MLPNTPRNSLEHFDRTVSHQPLHPHNCGIPTLSLHSRIETQEHTQLVFGSFIGTVSLHLNSNKLQCSKEQLKHDRGHMTQINIMFSSVINQLFSLQSIPPQVIYMNRLQNKLHIQLSVVSGGIRYKKYSFKLNRTLIASFCSRITYTNIPPYTFDNQIFICKIVNFISIILSTQKEAVVDHSYCQQIQVDEAIR